MNNLPLRVLEYTICLAVFLLLNEWFHIVHFHNTYILQELSNPSMSFRLDATMKNVRTQELLLLSLL